MMYKAKPIFRVHSAPYVTIALATTITGRKVSQTVLGAPSHERAVLSQCLSKPVVVRLAVEGRRQEPVITWVMPRREPLGKR